jgi:hypothetical protein
MAQIQFIPVDQSGAGSTTVLAAVAGERHKIRGGFIVLSAIGTLKFTDGTDDLSGAITLDQKAGFVLPASPAEYLVTPVNKPLTIVTTGGAARGALVVITEP